MHTNSNQQRSQKAQIAKKFLKADIFYQTSKEPLHLIYYECLCKYQMNSETARVSDHCNIIQTKRG